MAMLPLALVTGSAGLQAIGSVMQGINAQQVGAYNDAVQNRNAIITGQNASQDATAQAADAARKIGAARAGYAKAGVQLDEGSPLDVLAESARTAELDRQTILYQGRVQAQGYIDQGKLDRYKGNVGAIEGYMGGATALLKGGEDLLKMGAM